MARHRDAHLSFDVPRDWEDQSIVVYAAPRPDGEAGGATLVVTRDRLRDGEDLAAYADRQLDVLARRLDGFVLRSGGDTQLGGQPAVTVSFTSDGPDGAILQRLTVAGLPGRRVIAITMTTSAAEAAQLAPLFDRILSSLELGGGEA
jgi:hypothetical protein